LEAGKYTQERELHPKRGITTKKGISSTPGGNIHKRESYPHKNREEKQRLNSQIGKEKQLKALSLFLVFL